ncbi:HAD family hydrolase [Castellaniella sp.]|uniref:HAD family hydrolase n=1 Tax=Castellaniella sp. TaxID=1955812 RepID=UPI003A8CB477
MIAVLDFDGTVYKGNSFPVWIKYCLRRSLRERRMIVLLEILFLIFMRKIIFIYDHVSFKKKINEICYPECWAKDFCSGLVCDYNSEVMRKVKELPCSHVIISTAAPECYAAHIVFEGDVPLSHIVSSGTTDGMFIDNFGFSKMERTVRYIKNAGLSGLSIAVFTDHHSDFPLAKLSDALFLCNPDKEDIDFYRSEGVEFTILSS